MQKTAFNSGWTYHRAGEEELKTAVTLPHDAMLTVRHTACRQMLHCQSADFQHMLFFLSFSLLLHFSKNSLY